MLAYKTTPQPANQPKAPGDATKALRPVSRLDGQELRLLLVEDQPSDVMLAEELLEDCMPDYQWLVVDKPSIANAVSILHHLKFDLALVDLGLEDMQGEEVIATLRTVAPDLPIIVYSGSSDLELLKRALANGAQFCITKGSTNPKVVRAMLQCALAPEPTY